MRPHLGIHFIFLPGSTESWQSLSPSFPYVAGLKGVSNPGPFEQVLSDLTTITSPPRCLSFNWGCCCYCCWFFHRTWYSLLWTGTTCAYLLTDKPVLEKPLLWSETRRGSFLALLQEPSIMYSPSSKKTSESVIQLYHSHKREIVFKQSESFVLSHCA